MTVNTPPNPTNPPMINAVIPMTPPSNATFLPAAAFEVDVPEAALPVAVLLAAAVPDLEPLTPALPLTEAVPVAAALVEAAEAVPKSCSEE